MGYILPGILLASGIVVCFLGGSSFKSTPFIGGFLLGGSLAVYAAEFFTIPPQGWEAFFPFVVYAVGGVIGGLIAKPLYMVIVIVSGSALGVLLGLGLGFVINLRGDPQMLKQIDLAILPLDVLTIWLIIIFALAIAVISLLFDEFMLLVSTAFVGSALIVSSVTGLFAASIPLMRNVVVVFFAWFVVGLAGLVYQNNNQD